MNKGKRRRKKDKIEMETKETGEKLKKRKNREKNGRHAIIFFPLPASGSPN
jgi:hypothetical protein